MPKKISDCTREFLTSIPLPVYATGAYTVISHESVMNYSKQELAAAGFTIESEEYRCTADGNIAQGVYKLHYNVDPEMSMMFAWTNSYNKQIKFKCAIGGYINGSGNSMLSGEMGTWSRKHTGNADTEAVATIKDQVTQAKYYYSQLVSDKNTMKDVALNKRKQAQLLGILFAEYQILTTEQASIIRQQMDKPTFVFENSDSLWAFYNHVTLALQYSHPKTWMEDQRILHYFISTVATFEKVPVPEPEEVVVDPLANNYGEPENQTNLLTQIAEVEAQEIQIHIESDQEYLERVAEIEGEPEIKLELVNPKTNEELVAEYNATHDDSQMNIEYLTSEEIKEKYEVNVIEYTDPVGNTFELPSIEPEVAPHRVKFAIDETEEPLEIEEETKVAEVAHLDSFEQEEKSVVSQDDFDFDLPAEEETTDNIPDLF